MSRRKKVNLPPFRLPAESHQIVFKLVNAAGWSGNKSLAFIVSAGWNALNEGGDKIPAMRQIMIAAVAHFETQQAMQKRLAITAKKTPRRAERTWQHNGRLSVSTRKSPPSDFRKILERISHRHDTRRVFDGFTRLAACAVAAQTREPEYLEEAKQWERPELDLFGEALGALVLEMESKPFEDVLGGYYMEFALSSKGQQWNGEFHTPKSVCDLMAGITLGDMESLPPEGPITVCEPACGAGAMILSLAQVCPPEIRRRLRVTAIDISKTACDMAFINTSLWGVPTRVIHGNSLSLETWAAWSNIHYIAPWLPLALRMQSPEATEQGQPPKPAEVERIKVSLGQQELPL